MIFKPTKEERALQRSMEANPENYDLALRAKGITPEQHAALQEYRPGRSKGRKLVPTDEGWLPPIQESKNHILHKGLKGQAAGHPPSPPEEIVKHVEVIQHVEVIRNVEKIVYLKEPLKWKIFLWILFMQSTPLLKVVQFYFGEWWIPDVLVYTPLVLFVIWLACRCAFLITNGSELCQEKQLKM